MKRLKILPCVLLATSLGLGGCFARGSAGMSVESDLIVVEEAPPPPRVETPRVEVGFVWVAGHWYRHGDQWRWRDGSAVRERSGQVWSPGRWERRGDGHVWIGGQWSADGDQGKHKGKHKGKHEGKHEGKHKGKHKGHH